MTTRHATGPLRLRLLVAGVCAALLAQTILPAVHALETGAGASAWQVASDRAPAVTRAAESATSHDPTTCLVCRTLLRTSPVLGLPAPRREPCAEAIPAPPAAVALVRSTVAQTGHPPRAPPADALHLV